MKPLSALQTCLYSTANFGAALVFSFGNNALPLYLSGYGVSNALVGFLAQERSFLGGFAQPIVGAISDRTRSRLGRRKPFFLVGVPLTAVTLALLAFRPPLAVVFLLLAVYAFFLAISYDPYLAMLPDLVPEQQRGRVGSLLAVFNMAGQFALLHVASQWWTSHESVVIGVVAVGLLAAFAVTFFFVAEPAAPPIAPPVLRLSVREYVGSVTRHTALTRYVLTTIFFWLGTGGIVPFVTRFGVEELRMAESQAFQLVMVALGSAALAAVPSGILADRVGKKAVLAVALGVYAVAIVVGSQVQTVGQVLWVLAVAGAANGAMTALAFPMMADLMPRERAGELTGLGSAVWSVAQPVGSTLAGLMADLSGSLRSPFALGGMLVFVSLILLSTVRVPRTSAVSAQ